jgi:hypothetical protein
MPWDSLILRDEGQDSELNSHTGVKVGSVRKPMFMRVAGTFRNSTVNSTVTQQSGSMCPQGPVYAACVHMAKTQQSDPDLRGGWWVCVTY